ncbi:MAG: hypothetical protein Q9N34_04130 [Aquificota bacterium]|nr:hypothetical protein [Aquificota bacterium]
MPRFWLRFTEGYRRTRNRADAVELWEQDGYIYPIAIELELSDKKKAKVEVKLKSIAEAIGEYYSRVKFFFKRPSYAEKFKKLSLKIFDAEKIVRFSNLHGQSYLKSIEIYRDIEQELKHLHKCAELSSLEIDETIAKELSRKLK